MVTMSKKRRKAPRPLPVVTFRNVEVCFSARTVSVNGRVIGPIEQDCLVFPILSGDAVFMPRDMERVG